MSTYQKNTHRKRGTFSSFRTLRFSPQLIIAQQSCFGVSIMTTLKNESKLWVLIKRIPIKKGVLFHHFVHCVFLFRGPFDEITCYGGHWVHGVCAVLEILLRARDFQKLTYSSQGFHRVFDYLHAWYINDAAWKSFPGHVTSIGHFKVVLCLPFNFIRSVYLPTQISKQFTSLMF